MSMLTAIDELGIPYKHYNHVTAVREIMDDYSSNVQMRCNKASFMIKKITDIDTVFVDDNIALSTVQYIVDAVVRDRVYVDVSLMVDDCKQRAHVLVDNPKNDWMYKKHSRESGPVIMSEVEGVDIQVEVKADGKIKKGGKAILAVGLLHNYIDSCVVSGDSYVPKVMKKILVDMIAMTELGAGTYEYNMRVRDKLIDVYIKEKGLSLTMKVKGK